MCAAGLDIAVFAGVVVGAFALFLPRIRWISTVVAAATAFSLCAFLLFLFPSNFPCGAPIKIAAPWSTALLLLIYLAIAVFQLAQPSKDDPVA
jgi:hypothetical protein